LAAVEEAATVVAELPLLHRLVVTAEAAEAASMAVTVVVAVPPLWHLPAAEAVTAVAVTAVAVTAALAATTAVVVVMAEEVAVVPLLWHPPVVAEATSAVMAEAELPLLHPQAEAAEVVLPPLRSRRAVIIMVAVVAEVTAAP
jgi:hypothetical protein